MEQTGDNCEEYVLLSEVNTKCVSLAEKWNYIRDKNKSKNSLEVEIINRVVNQKMYLYCFAPISKIMGNRWCFISSDYLKNFIYPDVNVFCRLFLVNKEDRMYFEFLEDSYLRLMDVSWSDLYLNIDELAEF